MNYTVTDVKKWANVFLEENNFFMAHEATKTLLHHAPGTNIKNDILVQVMYAEYIKIMSKRPPAIKLNNDHEETINLIVRLKDNQIVDAYMVEDEHEE